MNEKFVFAIPQMHLTNVGIKIVVFNDFPRKQVFFPRMAGRVPFVWFVIVQGIVWAVGGINFFGA
jgi:hypothetical protein